MILSADEFSECFKCGESGHWANACPNEGGPSRSGPAARGGGRSGPSGGGAGAGSSDGMSEISGHDELLADPQNATNATKQVTGRAHVRMRMAVIQDRMAVVEVLDLGREVEVEEVAGNQVVSFEYPWVSIEYLADNLRMLQMWTSWTLVVRLS